MLKKVYLALATCWTIFVLVLCLVSFDAISSHDIQGADKYVHALFHFVFTLLWFLYFRMERSSKGDVKILLKVVIMSLVFGVAIEIFQGLFTNTRQADPKDVAANFTGAFVAAALLFFYSRITLKPYK